MDSEPVVLRPKQHKATVAAKRELNAGEAERFFLFNISAHADGECRGSPKTRRTDDLSDATLPIRPRPSAVAVGMRRKSRRK